MKDAEVQCVKANSSQGWRNRGLEERRVLGGVQEALPVNTPCLPANSAVPKLVGEGNLKVTPSEVGGGGPPCVPELSCGW